MRSIDIHAHLTPQCFIRATQAGQEWHGIRPGSVRIAPHAVKASRRQRKKPFSTKTWRNF